MSDANLRRFFWTWMFLFGCFCSLGREGGSERTLNGFGITALSCLHQILYLSVFWIPLTLIDEMPIASYGVSLLAMDRKALKQFASAWNSGGNKFDHSVTTCNIWSLAEVVSIHVKHPQETWSIWNAAGCFRAKFECVHKKNHKGPEDWENSCQYHPVWCVDSGTGWRVWVPKIWKEALKNIKTHLKKNVEIQSLRSKDLTVENEWWKRLRNNLFRTTYVMLGKVLLMVEYISLCFLLIGKVKIRQEIYYWLSSP